MNTARILGIFTALTLILSGCSTGAVDSTSADTKTVNGSKVPYTVSYDANKWARSQFSQTPTAEYEFGFKNADVFAMVIPERITIPLDSLGDIAIENARGVSSDLTVNSRETKTIDGRDYLVVQFDATIQDIPLKYLGYYTSGTFGSVQFVTYAENDTYDEYKDDMQALLNGLAITADEPNTVNSQGIEAREETVSGAQVGYDVAYDANRWSTKKNEDGVLSEYDFVHKDGDVYALVIPEKLSLSLEDLKKVALENAKDVSADVTVVSEETKKINGKDILAIKFTATVQGIPFVYYGYLYSGDNQTVQFMSYTSKNLADQYAADIEKLLDGLTIK